ncbi:MAG: hypothetical protein NVV59_11815 [Chitinophagaceae bacterium]|nr:hypothetical protein [Chitinophagaceae bacterium]
MAPGSKVDITTPFHVQLPAIFSRSGHDGQHYQVAQWYPKPAVYDRNGWHEMPYLDQGEFYAEFADYDVRITLPSNYVVASSGNLHDENEKQWLSTRKNFTWTPSETKVKTKAGAIKRVIEKFPASASQQKTLHYTINNAHDFAWFADKRFRVAQESLTLPSGKTIPISVFYLPDQARNWEKVATYAKQGIEARSRWIGEYPYDQFFSSAIVCIHGWRNGISCYHTLFHQKQMTGSCIMWWHMKPDTIGFRRRLAPMKGQSPGSMKA